MIVCCLIGTAHPTHAASYSPLSSPCLLLSAGTNFVFGFLPDNGRTSSSLLICLQSSFIVHDHAWKDSSRQKTRLPLRLFCFTVGWRSGALHKEKSGSLATARWKYKPSLAERIIRCGHYRLTHISLDSTYNVDSYNSRAPWSSTGLHN